MKTIIGKKGIALLVTVAFLMTMFAVPAESFAGTRASFTSKEAASEYYLQQLKNHASTITFDYETTNGNGSALAKSFNEAAFKDSASDMSLMGDYLRYGVYNGYKVSYSYYTTPEGTIRYTFTYKIAYKLTASENRTFERKLSSVMRSLHLSGKSQYAKVKAIYSYITKNVRYDSWNSSRYYEKYTAYGALVRKASVCQGYANLFYRMCKEAGLSVRIVTGRSRNQGHAWNIVKVGNKFYNVDATWDAGKSISNYSYFLKSNSNFGDHRRNSEYSNSLFNSKCPMSKSSTYAINYSKPSVSVKKTSKTSVKVSWKKVSGASGYYIYRSTNNGKTYKKISTVSKSKKNITYKKLSRNKKYMYKVKAYQKTGSGKTYSKLSSSKTIRL